MVVTGMEYVNVNLEVHQNKGHQRLLNNHQPLAMIGTMQHRHAMQHPCLEFILNKM
jgi:hypothetical protein